MRAGRSEDTRLVGLLQGQLTAGRDMSFVQRRESRIEALTKQQVDQAIRKIVDLKHLIEVTAGDFSRNSRSSDDPSDQRH